MSDGYSAKFSRRQCKIQLSSYNLGEQNVLKSAFCNLSKSLKTKMLGTMVPPPKYTGQELFQRIVSGIVSLSYSRVETYVKLLHNILEISFNAFHTK